MSSIEPDFGKRQPKPVWTDEMKGKKAAELFAKGYADFAAKEGSGGSATQDCQASLLYPSKGSQGATQQSRIDGSTKEKNETGCGHAEMAALHKFWVNVCGEDLKVFKGAGALTIQCETKPCCCRCSAVLGLLKVAPSKLTMKTVDTMGSTQWGVSAKLQDLLSQIYEVPSTVFEQFAFYDMKKK